MQNQETSNIYHGIITQKVHLQPIKPTNTFLTHQIVPNHNKIQATINALKFRFPLKYLGPKYQNTLMPCIPGQQHEVKPLQCGIQKQMFMIKVPYETQQIAYASGKRSAIYVDEKEGKLFRLKGCGNQLQGFNIQNNDLRGSHFFHTSKRELYMTEMMNKVFHEELNIHPPANTPLYSFNYPSNEVQKINELNNELKLIDKYCCVFATEGDRRAGTHLISALQLIYLNIFDHGKVNWKQILTEKNRIDDGSLVQVVTNFQLFMEEGAKFIDIYNNSSEIDNYVLMKSIDKIELLENQTTILTKIINKFVPQSDRQRVIQKAKGIKNWLKSIYYIICRIGWEMGHIKRVMCEKGISWGFFNDHGTQWHSNAHLNNFIVTRPKGWQQNSSFFLLPLDYDLAYTKDEFINIEVESENYGYSDENMFENYLCAEYNAMEMSLFGLELMDFTYGIQNQPENEDKKMGKICFRDTLVEAFTSGMRKKPSNEFKQGWNSHLEEIEALVEICLWISVGFQT